MDNLTWNMTVWSFNALRYTSQSLKGVGIVSRIQSWLTLYHKTISDTMVIFICQQKLDSVGISANKNLEISLFSTVLNSSYSIWP